MFRTRANLWFLLLVGLIPSLLVASTAWQPGNSKIRADDVLPFVLGLGIFTLLPCFITMILYNDIRGRFAEGKKWIAALLYLPVAFMMYWATYAMWYSKLHPNESSSTDSLVMILPVLYGMPAMVLIYFIMLFILKRKKKSLS